MDCFELLGVPKTATADEVLRAWRRHAMKLHPDRGGDPKQFWEMRKAYREAMELAAAPKDCMECGGSGRLKYSQGFYETSIQCPRCQGAGKLS